MAFSIKRENWKGKYFLVARKKGKFVSWKKWTHKVTKNVFKKRFLRPKVPIKKPVVRKPYIYKKELKSGWTRYYYGVYGIGVYAIHNGIMGDYETLYDEILNKLPLFRKSMVRCVFTCDVRTVFGYGFTFFVNTPFKKGKVRFTLADSVKYLLDLILKIESSPIDELVVTKVEVFSYAVSETIKATE